VPRGGRARGRSDDRTAARNGTAQRLPDPPVLLPEEPPEVLPPDEPLPEPVPVEPLPEVPLLPLPPFW
jgi:hypothetical protein